MYPNRGESAGGLLKAVENMHKFSDDTVAFFNMNYVLPPENTKEKNASLTCQIKVVLNYRQKWWGVFQQILYLCR